MDCGIVLERIYAFRNVLSEYKKIGYFVVDWGSGVGVLWNLITNADFRCTHTLSCFIFGIHVGYNG